MNTAIALFFLTLATSPPATNNAPPPTATPAGFAVYCTKGTEEWFYPTRTAEEARLVLYIIEHAKKIRKGSEGQFKEILATLEAEERNLPPSSAYCEIMVGFRFDASP